METGLHMKYKNDEIEVLKVIVLWRLLENFHTEINKLLCQRITIQLIEVFIGPGYQH